MLKILQVRLNQELFKLDLEKAEEQEVQLPTSTGSQQSKRISEIHLLLPHWSHYSLWLCGSQQNGKFLKRWEYQTNLAPSWEISIQVKKQQLQPDMEQQTGSNLGNEYVKAVYSHLAYLIYRKIHHVKCQAGWSTSWNQDCQGKY